MDGMDPIDDTDFDDEDDIGVARIPSSAGGVAFDRRRGGPYDTR